MCYNRVNRAVTPVHRALCPDYNSIQRSLARSSGYDFKPIRGARKERAAADFVAESLLHLSGVIVGPVIGGDRGSIAAGSRQQAVEQVLFSLRISAQRRSCSIICDSLRAERSMRRLALGSQ
jgi:hypothetical protein